MGIAKLFSKKSSKRIKDFKSNKDNDIDTLVDTPLIYKTKNKQIITLKKSSNLKITKDFFKQKTIKRVLSGFILFLLLFALWSSSIPSLNEGFGSDFIISLEPRAVYNGQTIQINVSVPNYYNISFLKIDMDFDNIVDLICFNNSSDYHIWAGSWVVKNMSSGYHIARIIGLNSDNLSYSASVEWKVLEEIIDKDFDNKTDDLVDDENFSEENVYNIIEKTMQLDGVIDKPVDWVKEITFVNYENQFKEFVYDFCVPNYASNIQVNDEPLSVFDENTTDYNSSELFVSFNISLYELECKKIYVNYSTPAPKFLESVVSEKTKRVVVSSDFHYSNITTITSIDNQPKNRISLYHILNYSRQKVSFTAIDFDDDKLIDCIEWIVPHLSEQVYEIVIEVEKAEHLDINRSFINDISYEVKTLDDVWSEPIYDQEFVRLNFVKPLINGNDITIYARSSGVSNIEVFIKDSNNLITVFENVTSENFYRIYLSNLSISYVTFDLRTIGDFVEYDFIVDPPIIDLINPSPNGTTGVGLYPTCEIWANDTEGDTLNVYWYENTTGDWVLRQTNESVNANSTVSWYFEQVNNYDVTYWWKVAVDDSVDNISAIFYFTTNHSIIITPSRWDIGIIQVGTSNETTGFHFNLTNNVEIPLYIEIKASNATNSSTGGKWILNSTPDYNKFTLQYNKSGGGSWATINLTYDLFLSYLEIGSYQTFDLKLITATSSSTFDPLYMELTFRCVKA